MKKCLYILLALQILGCGVCFIALLPQSVILAIVFICVNSLTIVLTYAVINNVNNIEDLWAEINRQRLEIKKLTNKLEFEETGVLKTPVASDNEAANGVWKCVKCETVNKQGTTHCSNCKAEYSSAVNPTDNPYKKKRYSRWIK